MLACLVPTVPLLMTALPPLADYPNHLARMLFLGTRTDDPAMTAMLAPAWAMLPNLGVDMVLPWVMRGVRADVAGRVMLAVLLVLPVLGVVALSRATFGVRSWWALGAALVACNGAFLLGFLNFLLGVGLAMLAAAGWFRFREVLPLAVVVGAVVAACVLFFTHLMGVAFFLMLVGACEAERCWDVRGGGRFWRGVVQRGAVVLVVVAGPVALYALTALHGTAGPVIWSTPEMKGFFALYPVLNYGVWLDVGTAAAIVGVLVAGLATGRAEVPVRWRLVLVGLAVLFMATPVTMKRLSFVDARFSVLLGFAVFAGVRAVRVPRAVAVGLCCGGVALLGVRTGLVAAMWHEYDAEVQAVRLVIAPVEAGARVLPVWEDRVQPYPFVSPRVLTDGMVVDWHIAALVMLDRRAFWPFLFADPGQQPIRFVGAYGALAVAANTPVLTSMLGPGTAMQAWMGYDYVLLMDPLGSFAGPIDARLSLVQRSGMAALYRVSGS